MKTINNYIFEKLQISSKKSNYTYDDIYKALKPISTKQWEFNEITWNIFYKSLDEFSWNTSVDFVYKIDNIRNNLKSNNNDDDNIYVIEHITYNNPPMSILFFDKNPFKYIIFYDNKFTDLIESYTLEDVKDEIINFIK